MIRTGLLLYWILLLSACSTSSAPEPDSRGDVGGETSVSAHVEVASQDGVKPVTDVVIDVPSTDVVDVSSAIDVSPADTVDVAVANDAEGVPDVPVVTCEPGEGCFMETCSEHADCQSGWCVQHLGESVCSQTCEEECPADWSCKQVAGAEPDAVYICVSDHANLCRPCAGNSDCMSAGGADDACLDYGPDGNFCGSPCEDDDSCPWGFSCEEVVSVEGSTLQQCVNDTGECPCTDSSVSMGLTTPCSVTNDHGTCEGKRACTENGLGACDASTPAEEICNGVDDDCDGDIDEPGLVDGNFIDLCDDGNPCTEDKCSGEEGCVNEALDVGDCSDGEPCTVADHCASGTCIGDPVECDDGNPCTDDVCTETGSCEFPANNAACDDQNPCTLADHCVDGECTGTPANCECQADSDCVELEDGDLCNGTLVCDTSALPYTCVVDPETVVICPEPDGDSAFCLKAACNPGSGECSFKPDHEGFLCDNGDSCTVNDKCVDGVCTGGAAVNCNDGNPCTDDVCDAEQGCTNAPNELLCNDGDVCTTNDACIDGLCVGGPALDCDDGDKCTTDQCLADAGCTHNSVCDCPPCTLCQCDESTGAFECTPFCDDGDACTEESCFPLEDGVVECVYSLVDCDDGNACTIDLCGSPVGCFHQSKCEPSVCFVCECEEGNPNVQYVPACDDGNACTLDTCDNSMGVPTCDYESVSCDDGNPCTDDVCDPLAGCANVPNQAPCDDGNACTVGDTCGDGACQAGSGTLPCDDGEFCTGVETCSADAGCLPGIPPATDDGVDCTVDSCDEEADVVVHMPDDSVCNDGQNCTDDSCDVELGCQSVQTGQCASHYILTGEPDPGQAIWSMAETYFLPASSGSATRHGPSNKIIAGHSQGGYWSFDATDATYSSAPNMGGVSLYRQVFVPVTRSLIVAESLNWPPPTVSIKVATLADDGTVGELAQTVFSDGFAGHCNLISASATEFLCFTGTEIRHYRTWEGSNLLTYAGTTTLAGPLPAPCDAWGIGGTFAWDGKFYYFPSSCDMSDPAAQYLGYDEDGLPEVKLAAPAKFLTALYFDWSSGRYAIFAPNANKIGTLHVPVDGSSTGCGIAYGPPSPYHTLQ